MAGPPDNQLHHAALSADLWREIEALAFEHADARVTPLSPTSDQIVDLPSHASEFLHGRSRSGRVIGNVSASDRAAVLAAWGRARRNGKARVVVGYDDGERQGVHTLHMFDLRESDDMMLSVMVAGANPEDLGAMRLDQNIRPRRTEFTYDEVATLVSVHDATEAMFDIAPADMIGRSALDFVHEDDHEPAITMWLELMAQPGARSRTRMQYRRGDGSWFWLEATLENQLAATGVVHGELVDVTEEMEALSALRHRERVLARLAEALPSGVIQVDGETVSFRNERWTEITGTAPLTLADLLVGLPDTDKAVVRAAFDSAAADDLDADVDVSYGSHDGVRRCRLSVRSLGSDEAMSSGSMIVSLVDITESWEFNNRLAEQAARDHLTGIPNRMSVMATLDDVLDRGRLAGTNTAVMYFDLNGFKGINDQLGHAVGDQLLQHVASVIHSTLRTHDTVGRIGGDEFIVVCPDVADVALAEQIADRIQRAVAAPVELAGNVVDIAISCGIAVTSDVLESSDELIAQADIAMYTDKNRDAVGPVMFEPQLLAQQDAERKRVDALRSAPFDSSLELHYQPILDLQTGATFAHEALLRWWSHGKLEAPMEFIPLAERQGMIGAIGGWVMEEACELGHSLDGDRNGRRISMNVSPLQLHDPLFPDAIREALDRHHLDPAQLMIELTESVMIDGRDELATVLEDIARTGVPIYVDDFGTGFATLDDLRQLPLTGIKIDREFTADLGDPRTETIVGAIIDLGRSLDLLVVAEGIETLNQATTLSALGAHYGQGFFFGRPALFHELSETMPEFLPSVVR